MSSNNRGSTVFSDADILEMARTVESHDFDRIAPPPQVWNNMLAELEVEVASHEASARRQSQSWVTSGRILSIAAATLLLVGAAVAVVAYQNNNDPDTDEIVEVAPLPTQVPETATPAPATANPLPATAVPPTAAPTTPVPVSTQIATAQMNDAGLPVATTETAAARVVCEGDDCFVEVDLTALPDAGVDDLELWVINDDTSDMHSLGLVTMNASRFALPAGVDAADFPIVDISVEPDDGDATHSGQSVLRGVFDLA